LTRQLASGGGRAAKSRPPVAEAHRVSKSFGSTAALTDVSLTVVEGECHALVGRNGAGKSTLVAALTGLIKPDGGQIVLAGEKAPALVDRAAWQARVACVYQHSKVVPTLTVAENLYLNRFERRLVSWRAMRSGARRILNEWGFEVDVDLLASELAVEQRQVGRLQRRRRSEFEPNAFRSPCRRRLALAGEPRRARGERRDRISCVTLRSRERRRSS